MERGMERCRIFNIRPWVPKASAGEKEPLGNEIWGRLYFSEKK